MINLGNTPQRLRLRLNRGADFAAALRNAEGPWPDGVAIELRAGATTWAASIVEDLASWSRDKADVDALLDTHPSTVDLFYVAGDTELLWARGEVQS